LGVIGTSSGRLEEFSTISYRFPDGIPGSAMPPSRRASQEIVKDAKKPLSSETIV